MSPHAARYDEALQALLCMTAWWGGWMPLWLASWRQDEMIWRQGPHGDLAGMVRWLDGEFSDEIRLGLPQSELGAGGVGKVSVLWCRVEGTEQLARARRLRPLPSLVLAEGASTRRLCFWALEEAVSWARAVEHNRKLAYAVRGVQKWGDPDRLVIPCPGTCLRVGRSRPVPVVVSRLTTAAFHPSSVTGRLREPPPKDAWLAAASR